MRVKEIMKKVVVMDSSSTVKDAVLAIVKQGIGSVVVLDKSKKLVGIVTERDILKHYSNSGLPSAAISKIMSKNVKTIDAGEDIDDAALIMCSNKIKRLPVVSKHKLIGIITATDLVAAADEIDNPFFF